MAKLQLRTNVPEVISLQFPQGKEVSSEYNGTETLYTLSDGRSWYVQQSIARKIDALSLGKGEPFEVTKVEAPNGAKGFTYEVKHFLGGGSTNSSSAPLAVQSQQRGTMPEVGPLQTNPTASTATTTSGKLMACFMAAVDSLVEVEAYAKRRGLNVQFNAEDVRACANTLFIAETRGGR